MQSTLALHPGSSGSIGAANFSLDSTVGAPYRVKDGSNRMQVLMAATTLLGHRSSRLGSLGVSEISACHGLGQVFVVAVQPELSTQALYGPARALRKSDPVDFQPSDVRGAGICRRSDDVLSNRL